MKGDPELIYAALFKQVCSINSPTTPLNTMSRRWLKWDQVGSAPMPAFYQMQVPGVGLSQQKHFGMTRYLLEAKLFFYFATNTNDLTNPTSPQLNLYFKAVDNALAPTNQLGGPQQGGRQQLGGNVGVENCWIEGDVLMDEGLLNPPGMLVVPVRILTG